jgi:filamentous hemagglutinin family protein
MLLKVTLTYLQFLLIGCLAISKLLANGGQAIAQVIPDGTLGNENSQVIENGSIENLLIEGGATRDSNLFHSFTDFNVNNGQQVYFANPNGIANILSRVTGDNASQILGKLGVLGNANLFLLNPNGIIFGANASLDVGGSFVGSSAEGVVFEDGTEFSAKSTQENLPLLTIKQPIGLNLGENPGAIANNASNLGLQVQTGQNITLVGGEINFDGGKLTAPGGRVELGSLASQGTVGLNADGSLSFPVGVPRGDINLANSASVNVRAGGGGFIGVNARNLELSGKSQLIAGIDENQGTPATKAGDITINATDSVVSIGEPTAYPKPNDFYQNQEERTQAQQNIIFEINQSTSIKNNVGISSEQRNPQSQYSTAQGNGGNITINTKNLKISNVASIDTSLYGVGNAGNIKIDAENISLSGGRSLITSAVKGENLEIIKEKASGNAGEIDIDTKSLFLGDNATILTSLGEGATGNAGTVTINASDRLTLNGNGIILAEVRPEAIGNAGKISITTGNLTLTNRSLILAQTKSTGNAGDILINVGDLVILDGGSIILASVEPGGKGNGGQIEINTGELELTGRSLIIADTKGKGNAGNITINSQGNTTLDRGSEIVSGTGILGENVEGDAGAINLTADSILLKDFSLVTTSSSNKAIQGEAKNINIKTDNLEIEQGSVITSLTENNFDAGDINIDTQNLVVNSGGKIVTGTDGTGKAGDINIDVANNFNLNGGDAPAKEQLSLPKELFNQPLLQNLVLETGLFANSTPRSTGNSGNIFVRANNLNLDRKATISAATNFDEGGNLNLQVGEILRLSNSSKISAQASGDADGGNIDIRTRFLIASPAENSDITASAFRGNGGNIQIETFGVFGIERRTKITPLSDINASSEFGIDGLVQLTLPNITPDREKSIVVEQPQDVTKLVGKSLCTLRQENQFVVTGRGGFSSTPDRDLQADWLWEDWSFQVSRKPRSPEAEKPRSREAQKPRVRPINAQSWYINDRGNVVLSAESDPIPELFASQCEAQPSSEKATERGL